MKTIAVSLGSLILLYLLIGLALRHSQERIVFPGSGLKTQVYPKPDWIEEISVETSDGKFVTVWRSLSSHDDSPTCVYFHGNFENISSRIKLYEKLVNSGCNVYALSYRGYYGANFNPSILTFYRDLDDFNQILKDKGNLYLIGYSLGGAAAAYYAFRYPVKKLVLASTFSDLKSVARSHPFYRFFVLFMRFDIPTLQFLSNTKAEEIFVIHGFRDTVVPPDNFHKIKSVFRGDERFRFKGYSELDHGNIIDGAWFDIKEFLFNPLLVEE